MKLENYTFDEKATKILEKLNSNGNKGYFVGGCLRDVLLGKTPKDIDIATNMEYNDIKKIFSDYPTKEVGKAFGILIIHYEDENFEIAKFRTDIGSDGRRPDSVEFVNDIEDDLLRRDFTFNAMAFNEKDGLIDIFNGQEDIKNKIIRFVGKPKKRLQEDGLRLMRAFRFMSQLGFDFEKNTEIAIKENIHVLEKISQERITNELNKLIVGKYAVKSFEKLKELKVLDYVLPELKVIYDFDQNNPYHKFTLWEHSMNVLDGVSPELTTCWSALLHDIGKPEAKTVDEKTGYFHFYKHEIIGASIAKRIMSRLGQSNNIRDDVYTIVKNHMKLHNSQSEKTIKTLISNYGELNTKRLIDLAISDDGGKGHENDRNDNLWKTFYHIVENMKVPTINSLNINGYDLMELGIYNKEIQKVKKYLLNELLEGNIENSKEELIEKVKEYILKN